MSDEPSVIQGLLMPSCVSPASLGLLCLVSQPRGGTGHPDLCTSVELNTWPRGSTAQIQTQRDTRLQTGINISLPPTLLLFSFYVLNIIKKKQKQNIDRYIFMVSGGKHVEGERKTASADHTLVTTDACNFESLSSREQ